MEVTNYDGTLEKHILVSIIMDDKVCAKISSIYEPDMMSCAAANRIVSWSHKYYLKCKKAPKKNIQIDYERWGQKTKNKDQVEWIGAILEHLSTISIEEDPENSEYMIEQLSDHLNKVKMQKTIEILNGELQTGNINEACKKLQAFKRIDLTQEEARDVLNDPNIIKETFRQKNKPIIRYPEGAIQEFWDDTLAQGNFVVLCGVEKRGKSVWLLDMAYRSVQQRNKTLYIQAGDLSEWDLQQRIAVRFSKRPMEAKSHRFATSIFRDSTNIEATTELEEIEYEYELTPDDLTLAYDRFSKRLKSNTPIFKYKTHPNMTISAAGIREDIEREIDKGFFAKTVIIDYLDNLTALGTRRELRHEINETWSYIRGLAMEEDKKTGKEKTLIVSATQADAKAYNKWVLDMGNFSESKNKNAHPNAIVGINQTENEKDAEVYRLNYMNRRSGYFNSNKCVYVAGSRAINNVCIGKLSTW